MKPIVKRLCGMFMAKRYSPHLSVGRIDNPVGAGGALEPRVLAYLLNPYECHDQGDRILRSFIRLIDLPVPKSLAETRIRTAVAIDPVHKLDILVDLPQVFYIGINNCLAKSGPDECQACLDWLGHSGTMVSGRYLVHITSNDDEHSRLMWQKSDRAQLISLSFNDLAAWLLAPL